LTFQEAGDGRFCTNALTFRQRSCAVTINAIRTDAEFQPMKVNLSAFHNRSLELHRVRDSWSFTLDSADVSR